MYTNIVNHTILQSRSMICNIANFSNRSDDTSYFYYYSEYKQPPHGIVFFNNLGRNLLEHCEHIKILDIGCGECKHVKNMFFGIPEEQTRKIEYVTVDRKPDELNNLNIPRKHITADVFDKNNKEWITEIGEQISLLIIDVEPHGNEWYIYYQIKHLMKPTHIIILKCIGYIDLMVTSYANSFIHELKQMHKYVNYFGGTDIMNLSRDIICIVGEDSEIQLAYIINSDGRPYKFVNYDLPEYIQEPSKKTIDFLLGKS